MGLANCMWCESEIRTTSKRCPECGLDNPVAAAPVPRRRRVARGRRLILSLIAVPLMLSVAYAAHSQLAPQAPDMGADSAVAAAPATAVVASGSFVPATSDPVQRGVWLNGERALRLALADPSFDGFDQSYVRTSAGQIVSLCGSIPSGAYLGMRYVSIAGDSAKTVIEGRDPGFDTLWTRLCARDTAA